MGLFFIIIFFILGLIIGSFLNVVICRLNTARSFGGRSACMSCQNKLQWHELVPLISFFALKGRCRGCKTKISIQYPLVEFSTGLIFALLFFKFSALLASGDILVFAITYAYYAALFSLLVIIAIYDLKHKIIPDTLSFIFGAFAFTGLFFFYNNGAISGFYLHIPSTLEFLSGLLITSPFAVLWLVSSGKWMGLGDAKLALGIGWLSGLAGALSGLVIAFWAGTVIGLTLVILSKNKKNRLGIKMKSEISFAPFLALGAFLAFIFELNLFGI